MSKIKVTPEEFKLFSQYILDISGIALTTGKEYLLETRLNPLLAKYLCNSYADLMKKSKHGFNKELEGEIIDAISTNETYFFRDKSPFKLLQHKILPDLIDKRSKKSFGKPTIKIWSAANSTGQELYSLAMTMIEMGVTLDKYNIRLFGTDISDAAIAKASYGVYNKFEVARGLEPARLNRFFEPKEDKYKVKDELRAMVQFKKMNLMKPFIGIGKFDIVLCRNVMIYFTTEDRRRIYSNISKVMEPDGYLLIGSTESLVNDTDLFASFRYLNSVFYQFKGQRSEVMGGINAQDFIDELIFCLNEKDIVKAKALLQFASDSNVDVQVQKMALAKLAKGPENVVFPLLEYLTKIEISNTDVQESLYDLILDKAYGNTNLVIEYIINNEKKTRIQFIRAAGDLFLEDTIPVLTQIVQGETDPEIIIPAIKSLAVFRKPEHIEIFASFTTHSDTDIIRAAIFAIGTMPNPQAADTLISFLCEDETINKVVVQALADKQELYDLEKITLLLSSPVTIIRDTAIDELINLGKKATPLLTRAFNNAEADYMVHLITTLGYIEDQAAIPAIMDIINTQPQDANIRQAAYEAMERIPSPRTAICLVQGLQDPEESVRMSAARAIDKNLSKPLVAGLKNIIRDQSTEALLTIGALIDTDATNIFNFLMGEESFRELAGKHITEKASPATCKAFLKNMASIGQIEFVKEIASKITGTNQAAESFPMKIVVVDDSKMMLKLYQNKLSVLGLACEIYHRPEDAVKRILSGKTDLVITDLNMPNISGLELTTEIRRKFTRTDLPILMITTQSDFVKEKEGDVNVNASLLRKTGINRILHKPFSDNDFKEAVFKLLPS